MDEWGTVSMSNMRNARKSSYKLVILEGINLKRVLNIDDKLFGKFFIVFNLKTIIIFVFYKGL